MKEEKRHEIGKRGRKLSDLIHYWLLLMQGHACATSATLPNDINHSLIDLIMVTFKTVVGYYVIHDKRYK